MGKTKKSNTKIKESRWTGSVFILGDKQERPTTHTFIIKTSGNKKKKLSTPSLFYKYITI